MNCFSFFLFLIMFLQTYSCMMLDPITEWARRTKFNLNKALAIMKIAAIQEQRASKISRVVKVCSALKKMEYRIVLNCNNRTSATSIGFSESMSNFKG